MKKKDRGRGIQIGRIGDRSTMFPNLYRDQDLDRDRALQNEAEDHGRTLATLPKKDHRLVKTKPTGRGIPWPYSEDEMAIAILETRGILAQTARYLACGRTALYDRIRASERLQAVLDEARSTIVDDLEETLYDKALGGDTVALIFALKTQGRDRGWNEHQKIEISDDRATRDRDAREDAVYLAEVLNEFRSLTAGEVIEGEMEEVPAIGAGSEDD